MTNDTFLRAKSCHEAGELYQAEQLYREVIDAAPESFKAYNNLGNVLEMQGRYGDAIHTYQQGVRVAPECFHLHYNLGHVLQVSGQLGPALLCYMKALNIDPTSCETHFNIGNLLYDQGRYESACEAFRRAIECDSNCRPALCNLALSLYELRQYELAIDAYRRAIAIDDSSTHDFFQLGKSLEALHRFDEAIAAYDQALHVDPQSSTAHAHRVLLLQGLGRDFEVEAAFQQWQIVLPDDPVALHLRAAFENSSPPPRAADRYVQAIFDELASDYDKMYAGMRYCVPRVIYEKLHQQHPCPANTLKILDAGCGTGLCGPLLRAFASTLDGVDLSLGMLERAKFRGTYDDLFQCELTEFLRDQPATYDVIVAADTFVYFGELSELLTATTQALRPQGQVIFTVESLDFAEGSGFRLNRLGRYEHTLEYTGLAVQRAGLHILDVTRSITRREGGKDVWSHVVTAQLKATTGP